MHVVKSQDDVELDSSVHEMVETLVDHNTDRVNIMR